MAHTPPPQNQGTAASHPSVKFPLEVLFLMKEIESFYKVDDPELREFPSLPNSAKPKNFEEYIELKLLQAEALAREASKGKSDMEYQQALQYRLEKIRHIEDTAQKISQELSDKPDEDDPDLREDYLEHIMQHKPYKATKSQFKNWTSAQLKKEIERITEMAKTGAKSAPPKWKDLAKSHDNQLKIKRMREILSAAGYGRVGHWSELMVIETFRKLAAKRNMDPSTLLGSKPSPPSTTHRKITPAKRPSSSSVSHTALKHLKRQEQLSKEEQEQDDDLMKEAIQSMIWEQEAAASMERPPSPNSSK